MARKQASLRGLSMSPAAKKHLKELKRRKKREKLLGISSEKGREIKKKDIWRFVIILIIAALIIFALVMTQID